VVEATDGAPLVPGTVHIAPGDFHLTIGSSGASRRTALNQAPPENFCRPAVDVLFRSAVAAYGGAVLGVVLTGMGSDGRVGAGQIRDAGGTVVAQDQATSVVWGMPGAVTQAGFADEVLPLDRVAEAIARLLPTPRPAAAFAAARSGATPAFGGTR
jgi:two-component system chemotaxis response regulator CheB